MESIDVFRLRLGISGIPQEVDGSGNVIHRGTNLLAHVHSEKPGLRSHSRLGVSTSGSAFNRKGTGFIRHTTPIGRLERATTVLAEKSSRFCGHNVSGAPYGKSTRAGQFYPLQIITKIGNLRAQSSAVHLIRGVFQRRAHLDKVPHGGERRRRPTMRKPRTGSAMALAQRGRRVCPQLGRFPGGRRIWCGPASMSPVFRQCCSAPAIHPNRRTV